MFFLKQRGMPEFGGFGRDIWGIFGGHLEEFWRKIEGHVEEIKRILSGEAPSFSYAYQNKHCTPYSMNSLFSEFFRKFGGVFWGVFETI